MARGRKTRTLGRWSLYGPLNRDRASWVWAIGAWAGLGCCRGCFRLPWRGGSAAIMIVGLWGGNIAARYFIHASPAHIHGSADIRPRARPGLSTRKDGQGTSPCPGPGYRCRVRNSRMSTTRARRRRDDQRRRLMASTCCQNVVHGPLSSMFVYVYCAYEDDTHHPSHLSPIHL
jgi:hypothetical protein